MSPEEISDLEKEVEHNPGKREAQRVLAREVTALVHGKDAMLRAEKISQALFYGNVKNLSGDEIEEGLKDVPSITIEEKEIGLVDLLITAGVSPSKRQAREDIRNRAIYINDQCSTDVNRTLGFADRLREKYTIIRRGKKNYFLVKWLS